MRKVLTLLILLATACAAVNHQKAEPPKPDQLTFRNLKVLRPDMTRDELIPMMREFARSLGVRCEHCHVQTAEQPKVTFDFPNDAKSEKNAARTMIRMVNRVNRDYVSKIERKHDTDVTCFTCHRGHETPESEIPDAAPEAATPHE
jgi:hypothetical protein